LKSILTLKAELLVTQGHWKSYGVVAHVVKIGLRIDIGGLKEMYKFGFFESVWP